MIPRILVPAVSGTLFGGGLALGGMTDPARVRGFLDVFGTWDPTLAFVMGGAVLVMAFAWRFIPKMSRPVFASDFSLPDRSDLTPQLLAGASLFGIGWGLAGLCPGPGFAILAIAPLQALVFTAALLVGMVLHKLIFDRPREAEAHAGQ